MTGEIKRALEDSDGGVKIDTSAREKDGLEEDELKRVQRRRAAAHDIGSLEVNNVIYGRRPLGHN